MPTPPTVTPIVNFIPIGAPSEALIASTVELCPTGMVFDSSVTLTPLGTMLSTNSMVAAPLS